jgi:UDP-N-acetylglucosamine 1-carboxyvinyltransferase
MYLLEASVTGTETALLAAAQARGVTEIRNAACEPHVAELCTFLVSMGVRVTGIGMSTIRVEPPARLRGASHRLRGDYIEAASWGVVGAVTGGDIEITGVAAEDLEPITAVLAEMQLQFELEDNRFAIGRSSLVGARRITTGLWPGFPSDIVSLVTVLATQAQGRTLVHDWMYELRLFALEQLSSMRGDLFLCDPHRIIVNGPTRLRGRTLDSRDIRSGMALIAAALAADGRSTVLEIETVERGYGDLVSRLTALGANVSRSEP